MALLLTAKIAIRSTFRNRRRSLLTLLAITVGVWSSIGVAALGRGMSNEMAKNAIFNMTGHLQIHAPGYLEDPVVEHSMDPLPDSLTEKLRAEPVVQCTTRLRVPTVVMSEYDSFGATLVGIDPQQERGLSVAGVDVIEGRNLQSIDDGGLVIGKKLASLLQTQIGKRVVIANQDAEGKVANRGVRVVGIFRADLEATEKSFAFVGRNNLQSILKTGGKISEVSCLTSDRNAAIDLAKTLSNIAPDREIKSWPDLIPLVRAILRLQTGFLELWFLVVVTAVGFGLVNTLFMSILERTREIGLVQALGMRPSWILLQILFESLFLLLVGIVLGNVLAFTMIHFLSSGIDISKFSKGTAMLGVAKVIYPHVLMGDVIKANLLILSLSLLASLYPSWRASKILPVEALTRT